jgi:hypothetical protein
MIDIPGCSERTTFKFEMVKKFLKIASSLKEAAPKNNKTESKGPLFAGFPSIISHKVCMC